MVVYRTIDREEVILMPEAEGIAANGSHEAMVFEAVRKSVEGLKITELPVRGHDEPFSRCPPLATRLIGVLENRG